MLDKLKNMFSGMLSNKNVAEKDAQELMQLAEMISDNSNEMFGLPEDYVPPSSEKKLSPEQEEIFNGIIEEAESNSAKKPMLMFSPVRADCGIFDSKLGGVPYYPRDMEYPAVLEGKLKGRPLHLLAQLNFGTIPHIEGFPESGILQLFVGCDGDDMMGMDFEDGTRQNRFRVIYHSDIITDESLLYSVSDMPESDEEDGSLPFKGEFRLVPSVPTMCGVSVCDHNFDDVIAQIENKLEQHGIDTYFLYDRCSRTGCHTGGYAYFTQDDPRGYNQDYVMFDTLLFQLDSEGDGEDEIMWGDCGVGNFFINSEDLKKTDFTRVLFNWDCC